MNSSLSLVVTNDGSATIYDASIGEHYHSQHGALQESLHVFIRAGIEYVFANTDVKNVRILEIGFGTGLNFILSSEWIEKQSFTMEYEAIESSPLDLDMIRNLDYSWSSKERWNHYCALYPSFFSNEVIAFSERISFRGHHTEVQRFEVDNNYDLIYYDAFSAQHQPEMWDKDVLDRVCSHLVRGGVFVTYSITGNLKRTLKELGFKIEKLKGSLGKREMLRAIKLY